MADDFKTTLEQISAKMATRQQQKIMVDGAQAMNRMAKALEANNRTSQPNNLPSGKSFAEALIKASPLFGTGFQTWMSSSLDNQNKLISDINNIDGTLKSSNKKDPVEGQDNTDVVEYLDLIADQGKEQLSKTGVGFAAMSTATSQNGVILGNILQVDQFGFNAMLAALGSQTAGVFDLQRTLLETGREITSELIRTRDEDSTRSEKDRLERIERSKEGTTHPQASSVIPRSPDDADGDGRADPPGGGGGGLAEIGGLITILGLFKKGLGGVFKLLKGFGGIFTGATEILPVMGKASRLLKVGPLALLASAIDFGKGFFDAKELLGKADVNFMDRMRAGVSEVVGGFGDIVDWIAKIFGFDTGLGKSMREGMLKITEYASVAWDKLVVWVQKDLFAGITGNTSLADIPSKLSDNLQVELTKMVDWIGESFAGLYDTAKKGVQAAVDGAATSFDKNIKEPFKNMINTIVSSILDVIGKVIDLVPSYLGGDDLRKKFDAARRDIMGSDYVPAATPPGAPAPAQTPESVATQYGSIDPTVTTPRTTATGGASGTMSAAMGKSAANVLQMQNQAKADASATPMVVQQSVNAPTTNNQTTNMTTNSLEPGNNAGGGRSLWGN